tara:strand:- start:246 stop:413 length:168 start_codon:yes stop_codon:yes gene_type:complete
MNVEQITLIMDSTKILKKMCSSNHDHTKVVNQELQKLVEVVMVLERRVNKLEKKK